MKMVDSEAVAVLMRRPDGSVYFAQRCNKEKAFYAYWAAPGGHVEEGETPRAAAVREIKEETDLDVTEGRLFLLLTLRNVVTPVEEKGTGIPYAMHYFGVDLMQNEKPYNTEPDKQQSWAAWHRVETLTLTPGALEAYVKLRRPGMS